MASGHAKSLSNLTTGEEKNRNFEKPHAISILKCKSNGEFEINVDALTQKFRQPKIQDMPISIVSISGEFRGGKSFMLNFFLHYLRHKGYEKRNWMGSKYKPLKDGFDWRGGRKACTNGIMMWSEIFYVKKGGKDVAIMLMDTQGLFDNQSDNKTNSIIFALSTLISSVQVFNLSKHIKQSDLGFLQFFTGYAEAASLSLHAKETKPFQTLTFLVRDWPFACDLQYGIVGGHKLIEETLQAASPSKELASVKKYLNASFSDIKCCLMPHPGKEVAEQTKFDGCLIDIEEEFLKHTESFVESLFKPENIVVKTINGKEVHALAILAYITGCSTNLKDGKLPNPSTMFATVAEAHNFQVQQTCAEDYERTMEEAVGNEYIENDQLLREMHEQTKANCLQRYAEETKFGGEDCRKKHRDYLEEKIARGYKELVRRNQTKKTEAEVKILQAIDSIAANYTNGMEQITKQENFIEDKILEKQHNECFSKARKTWKEIDVPDTLKNSYYEKFSETIKRVFERIKQQNNEKKEIAEAAEQKVK